MPRIDDSELKRLKDEVSVQRLVEEQQVPDCKPLFVGLDTRLGVSPIWTAEVLSCTLRALRFALGVARKPQQDARRTDYGLRGIKVLLQNCCLSQRRSLCSALVRRRAVSRHGFRAARTGSASRYGAVSGHTIARRRHRSSCTRSPICAAASRPLFAFPPGGRPKSSRRREGWGRLLLCLRARAQSTRTVWSSCCALNWSRNRCRLRSLRDGRVQCWRCFFGTMRA